MSTFPEDKILTVYLLRHQESEQNLKGHGDTDSDLTERGQEEISTLVQLVNAIGVDNIDSLIAGDLKRHTQTDLLLREQTAYKGQTEIDPRLNAVVSGKLCEQPAEITEQEYDLARFANTRFKGMTAEQAKVFPFDPLYSMAYLDKEIRAMVFPNEESLTTLKEIEHRIKTFQQELITSVINSSKPKTIVCVSSCSPNGFNLELAAYQTIGENMYKTSGSENRPIFPQQHDELIILGYSARDMTQGRSTLKHVDGPVKIQNYLQGLK